MNAISFAHPQPARPAMSGALVRDSLWAGLLGGSAMAAAGVLLAEISGYDGWFPLKALGSLLLGPSALSASGFAAAPVLAGLLIQLAVAALLGLLFTFLTRQLGRLPTDYGIPALSGLVFGLAVWLGLSLALPQLLPQLLGSTAPEFIAQYMIYGTLTGLIVAWLHPRVYAARPAGGMR